VAFHRVSLPHLPLPRLSGWPRRLAVLTCLLLAATSFVHQHTAAGDRPDALTRALGPDQVAVAVQVGGEVRAFVHTGDRVDLVAAASQSPDSGDAAPAPTAAQTLARGVRVLALLPPSQGLGVEATAGLVVAADRSTATALAAARGRQITALLSG
jgi:Flp pilus assembly protein CpaB